MKWLLTAIYVILTTSGLFCMKLGGDSLSLSFKNEISFKIGFITALGFLLYICSFLLWQKLIATYDLSYIVPIATGIVQIVILIGSYFFFKETISWVNIVGIILVIVGIVLIAIKR